MELPRQRLRHPHRLPTRERSGWVGDWQLYVDAAAYLYDVGDWSAKWLRDLEADQLDSGAVTNIVPDPQPRRADLEGRARRRPVGAMPPSTSRGSCYRATGRTDGLADQFDSMRRWVDFAATEPRSAATAPASSGAPTRSPTSATCGTAGGISASGSSRA